MKFRILEILNFHPFWSVIVAFPDHTHLLFNEEIFKEPTNELAGQLNFFINSISHTCTVLPAKSDSDVMFG